MQELRLREGQTLLRPPGLQAAEPGTNPGLWPHAQAASARDAELTGKRVRGEGMGTG